ncbi:MAG: thrombospondin type-1 domain-containing protein, partial [Candidatus Moranbacteria bacterium]|nr:thrombospondin type-1 domain-containing protein [Candidatus Moranbacteria bacterium]
MNKHPGILLSAFFVGSFSLTLAFFFPRILCAQQTAISQDGAADMNDQVPGASSDFSLPPGESIVAANVGIYGASASLGGDGSLSVSFDVVNHDSFVQPDIRFGVEFSNENTVAGNGMAEMSPSDRMMYEDKLTLAPSEERHMTLTRQAPVSLGGRMRVRLVSDTKSGLPLAIRELGVIDFPKSGGYIMKTVSCELISGDSGSVSQRSVLGFRCDGLEQGLLPKITIRKGGYLGDVVVDRELSKMSGSSLSFPLGAEFFPGTYFGELSFPVGNGQVFSAPSFFSFSIEGSPVSVQNVRFDKAAYRRGMTADISLLINGITSDSAANGGVLLVKLFDRDGNVCAGDAKQVLENLTPQGIHVWHASISVDRDCQDPAVSLTITGKDGSLLASYGTDFSGLGPNVGFFGAPSLTSFLPVNRLVIFGVLIVSLLVLISVLFVIRKKGTGRSAAMGGRFGTFLIIIALSFLPRSSINALTLISYPASATATTVVGIDKLSYAPGETIRLSGTMILDAGTYSYDGDHFISWSDVDAADPLTPVTKAGFTVSQSPNHFGCDRRYTSTLKDEWIAPATSGSHFLGVKHGDNGVKVCSGESKAYHCSWTSTIIIHGSKGCAGKMNSADGIHVVRGTIPFTVINPNPPINGAWSAWSACTASCGGGTQWRGCSNPAPANGGSFCLLNNGTYGMQETQACNTQTCSTLRLCQNG